MKKKGNKKPTQAQVDEAVRLIYTPDDDLEWYDEPPVVDAGIFARIGVRLAAEIAMMRGGKSPDYSILDSVVDELVRGQFQNDREV